MKFLQLVEVNVKNWKVLAVICFRFIYVVEWRIKISVLKEIFGRSSAVHIFMLRVTWLLKCTDYLPACDSQVSEDICIQYRVLSPCYTACSRLEYLFHLSWQRI